MTTILMNKLETLAMAAEFVEYGHLERSHNIELLRDLAHDDRLCLSSGSRSGSSGSSDDSSGSSSNSNSPPASPTTTTVGATTAPATAAASGSHAAAHFARLAAPSAAVVAVASGKAAAASSNGEYKCDAKCSRCWENCTHRHTTHIHTQTHETYQKLSAPYLSSANTLPTIPTLRTMRRQRWRRVPDKFTLLCVTFLYIGVCVFMYLCGCIARRRDAAMMTTTTATTWR